MARKRYNEEDILRLLREIGVHLHGGMDVVSACRTAGISDKTYYGWPSVRACDFFKIQWFYIVENRQLRSLG